MNYGVCCCLDMCSVFDCECEFNCLESDRGCLKPRWVVAGVSAMPAAWLSWVTFDLDMPPLGQTPAQVRLSLIG